MNTKQKLFVIILVLLAMYLLRIRAITGQAIFHDEADHNYSAKTLIQFKMNPGEISLGKFLAFYWFGIFLGPQNTQIFTSRTAIALASLLTAALVYRIGARLHSRWVGLVAMIVYVVNPLTVFYERMAMTDPFATIFSCAVAWASIEVAFRRRLRNGLLLGVLLALATFAKLTLALLPLLPIFTSFIYFNSKHAQLWSFARKYFAPLFAAAFIMILMWLPLVIPARFVTDPQRAFLLWSPDVTKVNDSGQIADNVGVIVQRITAFTGTPYMLVLVSSILFSIAAMVFSTGKLGRMAQFLIVWFVLSIATSLMFSTVLTSRYYVPAAAPSAIMIALVFNAIWNTKWIILKAAMGIVALAWILAVFVPFMWYEWNDPNHLPTNDPDLKLYLIGGYTYDQSAKEVADYVNSLPTDDDHIFAEWFTCILIDPGLQRNIHCFQINRDFFVLLSRYAYPQVSATQNIYFMTASNFVKDPPILNNGMCFRLVKHFPRPAPIGTMPIDIYAVTKIGCD